MSRLASILEQEYKTKGLVGGTASAVGKAAKEKLDIRNALFSGEGIGSVIGTKIFGKGYSATRKTGGKTTSPISDNLSSGESPVLQEMNANMKLTAKNSMSLPMMARDMNLMKLNIFKLVKAFGDKPNTNKTDMFWEKSKIRDAAYNNTIGKMMGNGNLGKMSKALFVGKKERDGQSPETALYITGGKGEGGEGESSIVGDILSVLVLKKILTSTLGFLTGPVGLTILGGFGLFKVMENLMEKNSDKEGVDLTTKALGGGLDESQIGAEIMNAAAEGQRQREAEELKRRSASGPLERLPQTTLPETGAGGGRGFVNPELVKPTVEAVPSNAIMSASGPIRTGSGGFVTSGEPMTTPTPTMPSSTTPTQDLSIGDAINNASATTGVSAQTLAIFGQLESGLGKFVENKLSSAKGPFQFIDSTWLAMMKKYGKKYGYDPSTLSEKDQLNLRFNNRLSALMAAEYTKENAATLKLDSSDPTNVDKLYLAHFLGPGGAKRVLSGEGLSEKQKESVLKYNPNIKTGSKEEFLQFAQGKTSQASKVSAVQQISGTPSIGSTLASASTSIADSKMALVSGGKGNTIINNNSPTTLASSSSGGSKSTPYQQEFYSGLVTSIAL